MPANMIYDTTHALTSGITGPHDAEIRDNGYAYVEIHGGWPSRRPIIPGHWHKTREEAVLKAKDMRNRKVQSLVKQISKIEGLTFS